MTEFKAISKVQIIVTIPLQAGYSYVIFNFYIKIFQTEVTNKVRLLIVAGCKHSRYGMLILI